MSKNEQLTTFYVHGELFGIDVMKVQEVTGPQKIVPIPLSPRFIRGLINLRGQISTAIGLKELFESSKESITNEMSVVCKSDGLLISLVVDKVGDVIELNKELFEDVPDTIAKEIKAFVEGVYKTSEGFISVLDVERIFNELSLKNN